MEQSKSEDLLVAVPLAKRRVVSADQAGSAADNWLVGLLKKTFLPVGYPDSVSPDYLNYQLWDSVQAIASSISNMIASRAVLEGVGVGNANATALNALYLTTVTDLLSRLFTLATTTLLSPTLSLTPKSRRLHADLANDMSILLSTSLPYLADAKMKAGAMVVAGLARAYCGVLGPSSKMVFSEHFVRRGKRGGNLGDVVAKDGSQEVVVEVVGMLLGTLVVSLLTDPIYVGIALFTLVHIHIYANYCAVASVTFPTLTPHRSYLLLRSLIPQTIKAEHPSDITFPSPADISKVEGVWSAEPSLTPPHSIEDLMECGCDQAVLKDIFDGEKYLLWPEPLFEVAGAHHRVRIVHSTSITPFEKLKAAYHAWLVLAYRKMYPNQKDEELVRQALSVVNGGVWREGELGVRRMLEEKGWDLDGLVVCEEGKEGYEWKEKKGQ
ncbi:hypothetical protein YB2330_001592 [Saitoella coloradoensis]